MHRQDMLALVLLVIASLITGAISAGHVKAYDAGSKRHEPELRAVGRPTLRILCLGASITYGYKSSDGNGFRYGLRKQLVESGHTVNMIGSRSGGTMADNQVEGWEGFKIAEVGVKAELSLPQLPNVVCIHVGTNDMIQGYNVPHAADRLAAIVDRIFVAVPGVTIIVSTLLPTGASKPAANVLQYNADLILVVSSRAADGKRITLVDMHSIPDLGPDGVHPTDAGYQKMATVFFNGIVSMNAVIQPPATVAGVDDAAAPDDKSAIVNVEVSCVVTVALSSTTCATKTSKPRPCDPKMDGCLYGDITTLTTTQVSSIAPSKTASTFASVKSVVAVVSLSPSETPTGKASISSSVAPSVSTGSETSMGTSTLAAIQESAAISTSSPIASSASTTLVSAAAITTSATAGSSTSAAAVSTTKNSASRAGETRLGLWSIVVIGIAGVIL